ncbi:cysteine synthase family protein [Streptomyces alkaliphilus]|uniref:cysteine synthase family protein n=1 Tax=Streptomyces alkaliphilus TaxID=1472722 RepID=UPI00117D0E70|nr:cysteine synthase family protein [Streptomyces alkaliphilus]MQS05943.1 pyridoxal-phosphate dependent enzyme [Streptomyces alkaliphilus]
MKHYLDRFEALLGLTPIKPITLDVRGEPRRILLKLEGYNLTGSIKARTAYGLVRGLTRDGRIRPGVRLIESTSGNLGVALAGMARFLDLGFTAVLDPMSTVEVRSRLTDLGADIVMVDEIDEAGGYLLSRLAKVQEMLRADDGYVWVDQYNSPENPDIHRRMTGPEILDQLPAAPDALFAAVSTGGTFAGISQCFRERGLATRMVAVDVNGSVAYGGQPGRRYLSGIGAGRPSSFLKESLVDHYAYVDVGEAAHYCRTVLKETGIHLGASSGAVVAACVRYMGEHPDLRDALCICADGGEKHESTIYSDTWLTSIGALPRQA